MVVHMELVGILELVEEIASFYVTIQHSMKQAGNCSAYP